MIMYLVMMPAFDALVPLADVTHTADMTGDWSDTATWAGGVVPPAGARVLISDGVEVTYDMDATTRIDWIRVAGTLTWAIDRNTTLYVEHIISDGDGTINIGTLSNPIPAVHGCNIVFIDKGNLDPISDTELAGRGLIAFGPTNMHGAQILTFGQVSVHPEIGHTQVIMADTPTGWKIGDDITIGGTANSRKATRGSGLLEDEKRVITGIAGNVVSFSGGLAYDKTIDDFDLAGVSWDLKTHVQNNTRNIVLTSENTATRERRGHVMLMHNPNTDIRYVQFLELGRTEKRYKDTHVAYVPGREAHEFDDGANGPLLHDSNVKGRYACHFHRHGVSSLELYSGQAVLVGNSVVGSPGWGYAQHDSNVLMYLNTAEGVMGGSYVAESGNERGLWKENIAMSMHIGGGCFAPAKLVENTNNGFDLARNGSAFRIQSRQIRMVDNVAHSCMAGSEHFHRGRQQVEPGHPTLPKQDGIIFLDAVNLDVPDLFGYTAEYLNANWHPILHHSGQISIACQFGALVEKAGPAQRNHLRTAFQDFKMYNCYVGVEWNYTGHYLAKNGMVKGWQGPDFQRQKESHAGIQVGANSLNMSVVGNAFEGTKYLYDMSNKINAYDFWNEENTARDHHISSNDEGFYSVGRNRDHFTTYQEVEYNWQPFATEVTALDLTTPFSVEVHGDFTHPTGFKYYLSTGPDQKYEWTQTDSMGTLDSERPEGGILDDWVITRKMQSGILNETGYWTEANGQRWIFFESYFTDRGTGEHHKRLFPMALSVFNFSPDIWGVPINNGMIDFTDPVDTDNLVLSGRPFPPLNGRIIDHGGGTYRYHPDPGFNGQEKITYWLTDRKGYIERHVMIVVASAVSFPDFMLLDLAGGGKKLGAPQREP